MSKGALTSFQVALHAKIAMIDSKWIWNLYFINNLEDTVVFNNSFSCSCSRDAQVTFVERSQLKMISIWNLFIIVYCWLILRNSYRVDFVADCSFWFIFFLSFACLLQQLTDSFYIHRIFFWRYYCRRFFDDWWNRVPFSGYPNTVEITNYNH